MDNFKYRTYSQSAPRTETRVSKIHNFTQEIQSQGQKDSLVNNNCFAKLTQNQKNFANKLLINNEKVKLSFSEKLGKHGFQVEGDFWTSKQRSSASIHEIPYRACFKAELPQFFISRFSRPNDIVYDPFGGRGTTAIQAGLMNRRVIVNDINPLTKILTEPRFCPPKLEDVASRLEQIHFDTKRKAELDLSMFYHPKTEAELVSLKEYIQNRKSDKTIDFCDKWIQMVATTRLTGHSRGYFSVYTLPPNQSTSQKSQSKINRKRKQTPEYRDVKSRIIKKTKALLKSVTSTELRRLNSSKDSAIFLENDAAKTPEIKENTVNLTVTSPPFLNIVQYSNDNWLRCWFNSISTEKIQKKVTMAKTSKEWEKKMESVFHELFRISKNSAIVAFEVGELKNGTLKLENNVLPVAKDAGFVTRAIVLNIHRFTKTSNIWGIKNNEAGTNTNRIVLLQKCK